MLAPRSSFPAGPQVLGIADTHDMVLAYPRAIIVSLSILSSDPSMQVALTLRNWPMSARSLKFERREGAVRSPFSATGAATGSAQAGDQEASASLDESLAISWEPAIRPLMEKVLSRRELLGAQALEGRGYG